MDYGIKNKVALISGGTSGIGFSATQALLNEGVNVVVFSRSKENIDRAKKQFIVGDSKLLILQGDLSNSDSLEKIIKTVNDELGTIDIFVASSGGPSFGEAQSLTEDDFNLALQSNFVSIATLTNKLLPSMKAQKWGRIVFVTTSGVIQPVKNLALSNVARSALVSFAKTLSSEIASEGITVNSVIPGMIETTRLKQVIAKRAKTNGIILNEQLENEYSEIPAKRFGTPQEIANLIVFLCSQGASYVTGSRIAADGGYIKSQ
ncbi:MAG: SDR family oxidoreductase [Acidimicrobiia bacterium]|nr:SDR family oxidoreductase [Acidimicrobiia bacterium]